MAGFAVGGFAFGLTAAGFTLALATTVAGVVFGLAITLQA